MVITGGGFNKVIVGPIKCKFEELLFASLDKTPTLDLPKGNFASISFYKEKLPGGARSVTVTPLIRARMANFVVQRILVDQGSSLDIMYSQLFSTLQLDDSHLTPYVGSDV